MIEVCRCGRPMKLSAPVCPTVPFAPHLPSVSSADEFDLELASESDSSNRCKDESPSSSPMRRMEEEDCDERTILLL